MPVWECPGLAQAWATSGPPPPSRPIHGLANAEPGMVGTGALVQNFAGASLHKLYWVSVQYKYIQISYITHIFISIFWVWQPKFRLGGSTVINRTCYSIVSCSPLILIGAHFSSLAINQLHDLSLFKNMMKKRPCSEITAFKNSDPVGFYVLWLWETPKVKYGIRSPKFIWAPVYSCTHWLRPRNSPLPTAFGLICEDATGQPR